MVADNSFSNKPYSAPPLSLLSKDKGKPGVGDVKANLNIIKRTLKNFGIPVEMDEVSIGPSVTRYSLKPAEGVKLSRIVGLQNELALALAAHPVRIEAPIPGTSLVGIEIPNSVKTTVGLGSLLGSSSFTSLAKPLLVALGKSISGVAHIASIAKMPHMLIAGTTGSGKSVCMNSIIASLLYKFSPDEMRMVMIDPKVVELQMYNKLPHLVVPVVTDPKKVILALRWVVQEMEKRYKIFAQEIKMLPSLAGKPSELESLDPRDAKHMLEALTAPQDGKENLCAVCWDNERQFAFLPCGHFCICRGVGHCPRLLCACVHVR